MVLPSKHFADTLQYKATNYSIYAYLIKIPIYISEHTYKLIYNGCLRKQIANKNWRKKGEKFDFQNTKIEKVF